MVLVDSNIIFDVWDTDPVWAAWSQSELRRLGSVGDLVINSVIFAELSPRYSTRAKLEFALEDLEIVTLQIPDDAAYKAGKAFGEYRKRGGIKTGVLSDFFIGAHAEVLGCSLLTRDTRRYATYFPAVHLITP